MSSEPTEDFTALIGYSIRFVQIGPHDWVNPELVAHVREFPSTADDEPSSCEVMSAGGNYITTVDGTAAEIVAKLTADPGERT